MNGKKEEFATMKTKKFIKAFGLSAVALLGLTACGTITAKASDYSEKLITASNYSGDIYHNIHNVVYDAIHKDGIGSNVLEEVLYLYAVSQFGPYDSTVTVGGNPVGFGEVTLADALKSDANLNIFVRAHKAYWDEGRDPAADASATEKSRVKAKQEAIEEKIAVKMYNKIKDGSYSDRHLFSEKKLLQDLRKNLESVQDPDTASKEQLTVNVQISPDLEPKDVFNISDEKHGVLHRENYQSEANTYIVEKIVPEIYRELLNELYVIDNNYNALGRSYARKVNIIEFKHNSNYPNAAYYLASELVARINEIPAPNQELTLADLLPTFKNFARASIYPSTSTEKEILESAGGYEYRPSSIAEVGDYYLGTEYGDLASKYVKMVNTKGEVDTTLENSFTNNGAYPTYVGLDQQRKELQEKDYVTSGWFIKNGGLNSLPSDIRGRLFNIAVANGVKETADEQKAASRTYDYVKGEWKESENENSYVCRINGHNFLKTASRIKGESIERDILHYDSSSKSYYIIEILEAVSSSKLSREEESQHSYIKTRGVDEMEKIINAVNELVAAGESYSTLATKKYLSELAIEYHDDSVYNYFKTNYPELFE